MTVSLLRHQTTGLIVVDAQTKLLGVMKRGQAVVDNIVRLLHLADRFDLPVIVTEQYARLMGPIVQDIVIKLPESVFVKKMDFNCCAVDEFNDRLGATGAKSVVLTGFETHICILQTGLSLLEAGYVVHVPQDAVDSRTDENWRVGIEQMREAGVVISSTEAVIFQLLGKAGTPEFKDMLRIIE